MKKLLVLLMAMSFIVGCRGIYNGNRHGKNPAPQIVTKHCSVNSFKSIVVSGNAQVELVKGKYAIDVAGVQAEKFDCQTSVEKQVLYIKDVDIAKISAPDLRNLTVTDNAVVSSRNFKADRLSVTAKDHGNVSLEGHFNVEKIFQFGHGRIDIDWISGDNLVISSYSNGPIHLAGVTNNLFVKLLNDATFNARYLRGQKISVVAADSARAEVTASDTLKAYAINKSSVYYYQRPKHLTVVTRDSGNVLRLDWVR